MKILCSLHFVDVLVFPEREYQMEMLNSSLEKRLCEAQEKLNLVVNQLTERENTNPKREGFPRLNIPSKGTGTTCALDSSPGTILLAKIPERYKVVQGLKF